MDCARVSKDLGPYLEATVTPAARSQMEGHLRECSACRAELQELNEAVQILSTLHEISPPPELRHRILASTVQRERHPVAAWLSSLLAPRARVGFALGAAALLALSLSLDRNHEPGTQVARVVPSKVVPQTQGRTGFGNASTLDQTQVSPRTVRPAPRRGRRSVSRPLLATLPSEMPLRKLIALYGPKPSPSVRRAPVSARNTPRVAALPPRAVASPSTPSYGPPPDLEPDFVPRDGRSSDPEMVASVNAALLERRTAGQVPLKAEEEQPVEDVHPATAPVRPPLPSPMQVALANGADGRRGSGRANDELVRSLLRAQRSRFTQPVPRSLSLSIVRIGVD
ncbi:MAG TPA: zf-HC2 domain-containing protein [Armatimonadota bacterium]|jgi:hypothetical protein